MDQKKLEQKLLENMADILEVDVERLTMKTFFRDEQFAWDSLKGYVLLVMLEEEFNARVTVAEFLEADTIQDLLDFCR